MRTYLSKLPWPAIRLAGGVAVLVAAWATHNTWWPPLSNWVDSTLASGRTGVEPHTGHDHGAHSSHSDHAGHDHSDHSGHDHADPKTTSLQLTPQALRNLGLTAEHLQPIVLESYRRSITVPALVVAKPGRSSIIVSSPLNGVVTHVHAVTGEAVMPGELLFEVRLTYEDLVETQTSYLKTMSELQVEQREITRLEEATRSGAVSGKQLLDRRYAKEKLEAFAKSQREALRLHGLSDRQVDEISNQGKLLRDLQIVAPDVDRHDDDEELRLSQKLFHSVGYVHTIAATTAQSHAHDGEHGHDSEHGRRHEQKPLVIDELLIHKGQAITAGDRLCALSDYSQLFIEGKAFESDVTAITQAAKQNWPIDATLRSSAGLDVIHDLQLAFVSNSIDPQSRTLSLYVELPNEIVQDTKNAENQRFISWKYRLGQRMELQIPVEQWDNQIVLPVDAVVKEGADWFVFAQNGKSFTRVPVHVRHRDPLHVVIANDGSIYPGDVVARKSAHQMQMAIKNASGAAVDPHAGHTH